MSIQRLTLDTIGKIAAGEVIERPAAAVRELVENSIDAGATRIEIIIEAGGIARLEARDNGIGIAAEEMPLAIERHATSKITLLEDLDELQTLGFRGEALASLAAVSDLTLQSRHADERQGTELRIRHGADLRVESRAWNAGTTVIARELFGNVPARRKFLRLDATEAGYVNRVVGAYALAYPGIAMSLEIDGRSALRTDGRGDPLGAAVGVWGADVAERMVTITTPVASDHEGYLVSGIVSLADIDRATRQQQFFFAQGRLITSRQLSTAFSQAYSTLLLAGRHPIGCIQIWVPPSRIDVNVHPTKAEVRFADERLIFALVQRSVREALLDTAMAIPTVAVHTAPIAADAMQRHLSLANPVRLPRDASHWAELDFNRSGELAASGGATHDAPPPEAHVYAGGTQIPLLRVLGQVAAMFIVAEGPDGMYLVDQHAAHERIMFERLLDGYVRRHPDQQMLLEPLQVSLSPSQLQMFEQCADELTGIGFDVEVFGQSGVLVRAVPAILRIRDAAAALVTILDELQGGGRGTTRLESLAISAACHTSIRAGQPLSLIEMRDLVRQLEACASPLACGHGRPTIIRMSPDDLARQFSRR